MSLRTRFSLLWLLVFSLGTTLGCPSQESPKQGSEGISSAPVEKGFPSDMRSPGDAGKSEKVVEAEEDVPLVSPEEAGSGDADGGGTPAETTRVEPAPPVMTLEEKLRKIRRQMIVDEGALSTTASNLGSAQEVIQKLERTSVQLNVLGRIPLRPDVKKLEKELYAYSKAQGLKMEKFSAEEGEPSSMGIPSTIVGNTKIHYLSSQVRGVISCSFELSPIQIDALESWLKRLPAGIERMVDVQKIRAETGHFRVEAKSYWYLPEAYPEHRAEILSLLAYLRNEGVEGKMSEIEAQAPAPLWKKLRELQSALQKHDKGATRTLTEYARANHLEARWDFFEKTARTIESVRLTELFD